MLLDNVTRVSNRISEHIKKIVTYEKNSTRQWYLNFLEWNKIFMVAEDNPNGLNKYKDSPTQLANKLPGANKSFTKKKTFSSKENSYGRNTQEEILNL
jgi:hypothetical protein